MIPVISVQSRDPDVAAAVRSWLAEGRLEPPAAVVLEIVVGDPPPADGDERTAFRQPGLVVRAGPPQGGVEIRWDVAPAVAELAPRERRARVVLSPQAVARLPECLRTFLLTVLVFLLRRVGWHHIHAAAALDPGGRGWLVAGDTAAGKSTTAALLASCGWAVGADDVSFLAGRGAGNRVPVMAYRAPIALRPGGRRLLTPLSLANGVLLPERRKVGYWPEELGGRWIARVEPEVILFTSVSAGGAATQAEPLGRRESLAELIRWSAWVILEPELAEEHLGLLAALAGQARSFRVRLGRDLFSRPARLAELVA